MICSALLEIDRGWAVLGLREILAMSLSEKVFLEPSEGREGRLELIFLTVRVKSGCIIGMFPMTTATNVSLTAQLPAC